MFHSIVLCISKVTKKMSRVVLSARCQIKCYSSLHCPLLNTRYFIFDFDSKLHRLLLLLECLCYSLLMTRHCLLVIHILPYMLNVSFLFSKIPNIYFIRYLRESETSTTRTGSLGYIYVKSFIYHNLST